MGEVIVTPPRVREEEKQEEVKEVENQTDETQEEIQQHESSSESEIETQPEKEENMNTEKIKETVEEAKEIISAKASEIKSKTNKPWVWMLAGAGLILALLIGTNHLVWTNSGPILLSMEDAYEAGKSRAIKDIENMPWYSRVWRGFTGDYHSK